MLLALTSPAFAGEAHLGANTVATGGASTAYPSDNSAVSASPGMLALTERYDGMGFAALGPVALGHGLVAGDGQVGGADLHVLGHVETSTFLTAR